MVSAGVPDTIRTFGVRIRHADPTTSTGRLHLPRRIIAGFLAMPRQGLTVRLREVPFRFRRERSTFSSRFQVGQTVVDLPLPALFRRFFSDERFRRADDSAVRRQHTRNDDLGGGPTISAKKEAWTSRHRSSWAFAPRSDTTRARLLKTVKNARNRALEHAVVRVEILQ